MGTIFRICLHFDLWEYCKIDMGKFIFLDIDGVLNTANYQSWRQFIGKTICDEYGHLFSPKAVRNLERLIRNTGAKIVLTSSWRLNGLDLMRKIWKERKMPGDIYDITPYVDARKYPYDTRGIEVKTWIEEKGHKGCSYVIIDDVYDFLHEQRSRVVLTNCKRGLSFFAMLRASYLLNKPKDKNTYIESLRIEENTFHLTEPCTIHYLVHYGAPYTGGGEHVFPIGSRFRTDRPMRNDALYIEIIPGSIPEELSYQIEEKEKEKIPKLQQRYGGFICYITAEQIQTLPISFEKGSKERLLEILRLISNYKYK